MERKIVLIKKPILHALIETHKEMHGWYPGKRECTSERLLINPYNGCSVNCFFCYARALPGYFNIFHKKGIVFVCKDFDQHISKQLDSLRIVSCGYLSPVTDPFQELEKIYHLSEKIIKEFIKRNIPIEFITKCKIPQSVIELMKYQKHSFGQVSILTLNDKLRKIFSPRGADTPTLIDNLVRLSKNNIFAVCRIDPIFPFITDSEKELSRIIKCAVDAGAKHIVASILDLPLSIANFILARIKLFFGRDIYLKYISLYKEKIGYLNAKIDYRRRIFEFLKGECQKRNITFALCMEYQLNHDKIVGLNNEFMTVANCEGINIPLYTKKGEIFEPLYPCKGNCLLCKEALCGIKDLALSRKEDTNKSFRLKHYRQWSKILFNSNNV